MKTPIGVVLMAYGTPRSKDEILPYYTDIRRGRPPTEEQLGDLIRRYEAIGGLSPLAKITDAQRDSLQAALDAINPGAFTVRLGLKHAAPMIEVVLSERHLGKFTLPPKATIRNISSNCALLNAVQIALSISISM